MGSYARVNGLDLYYEIHGSGQPLVLLPGSFYTIEAMGELVAHLRTSTAEGVTPIKRSQRTQALSPRSLRWLLMRERKDLNEEERAQLDRLLSVSPEVQTVHALLHTCLALVRERKHQHLRSWMEEASKSGIAELKSFVAGVERDDDAVKEALRLPWSQRPTEGKVNQLKTMSRDGVARTFIFRDGAPRRVSPSEEPSH